MISFKEYLAEDVETIFLLGLVASMVMGKSLKDSNVWQEVKRNHRLKRIVKKLGKDNYIAKLVKMEPSDEIFLQSLEKSTKDTNYIFSRRERKKVNNRIERLLSQKEYDELLSHFNIEENPKS